MENLNIEDIVLKDQDLLKDSEYLSTYFDKQLILVKDEQLRHFLTDYLNSQPRFNIEKATSSTGKYHPSWQNEFGGNGRHTKNVVKVLQVYQRAYPNLDWDSLYAAAILHDFSKYSSPEAKYTSNDHSVAESERLLGYYKTFKTLPKTYKKKIKFIADLIYWHDGRFNCTYADKKQIAANYTKGLNKKMKNPENHLLHLADMISASKDLWAELI